MVQVEVQEDAGDDRRVGEEGEDLHLSAATATRERPVTGRAVATILHP